MNFRDEIAKKNEINHVILCRTTCQINKSEFTLYQDMPLHHCFSLLFFILLLNPCIALARPDDTWVNTHTLASQNKHAQHIGRLQLNNSIRIIVALKLRQQSKLDARIRQEGTGNLTQALSRQEFMFHHAPAEEQIREVAFYLLDHGFLSISVADNRMLISATGTTAAIEKAFNTELHYFEKSGQLWQENVTPVMVPGRFSDSVLAVIGLQGGAQQTHTLHTVLSENITGTDFSNKISHYPHDFPGIYNADRLNPALRTSIAIITQGDVGQTIRDLHQFAAVARFAPPYVRVIPVGSPDNDTSNTAQWNLSTQIALAAAGGNLRHILLYNVATLSDTELTMAYNQVVIDNIARVINISFGQCEDGAFSSGLAAVHNVIFQIAIAQGQTFVASAGDTCDPGSKAQSYPASSPYVMSIGGTSIATTQRHRWLHETVWSKAGGGPSASQPASAWQIASGVLTEKGENIHRGVPDISFNADPDVGALILVNGTYKKMGGTGLSSALFTGFWARIQSNYVNTLPFPAATLYDSNWSWFNDITSGSNAHHSAKVGWDYASGFGSLNINYFASTFLYRKPVQPQKPILLNNVPTEKINLSANQSIIYTIAIPKNKTRLSLRLTADDGKGDGDLYVKFGLSPTSTFFDAKSISYTNNELITVPYPQSGVYHIMVMAHKELSDATLIASYD